VSSLSTSRVTLRKAEELLKPKEEVRSILIQKSICQVHLTMKRMLLWCTKRKIRKIVTSTGSVLTPLREGKEEEPILKFVVNFVG
jgi:hypothetical protein